MKKLRCYKCGYAWVYSGKSKFYTSCPICRNSNVDVQLHRILILDAKEELAKEVLEQGALTFKTYSDLRKYAKRIEVLKKNDLL